jgi:hypothetical protein
MSATSTNGTLTNRMAAAPARTNPVAVARKARQGRKNPKDAEPWGEAIVLALRQADRPIRAAELKAICGVEDEMDEIRFWRDYVDVCEGSGDIAVTQGGASDFKVDHPKSDFSDLSTIIQEKSSPWHAETWVRHADFI